MSSLPAAGRLSTGPGSRGCLPGGGAGPAHQRPGRRGALPGGGVDRRRRRSGEGEGPVLAEWTRSRLWLRVAPPGFIGRRRGRSSHKRQLSKRPALIGPAPLTHRPRRTVQHFFTPSPLLLQKKKKKKRESDGLGESESEIEEEEGESFGFGCWARGSGGASPGPPPR